MKIYISQNFPEDFVYHYIPKVLIKFFLQKMKPNVKTIDEFLLSNYKINHIQLINLISKSIVIRKYGNLYIITIGNDYVSEIMRVIDYGNSNIKGLNIFNYCSKRVQDKVMSLYTKYQFISKEV